MPSRDYIKYFSILDGSSLTNEDEAGDPRYYGYTRPGGEWQIMQYNAGSGTYRFAVGITMADFDTNWTNRASLTYIKAGQLSRR